MNIFDYRPISSTPWSLRKKLLNRLWELINSTVFRWSPRCMNRFRVGLLSCFGANIASDCSIHPTAVIDMPYLLTMKSQSSLGRGCYISAGPVYVGQKCCIGAFVKLLPSAHNINSTRFEYESRPIHIEDGCWIATGTVISPPAIGINIAAFSVIASGSVVTKSTIPFSIYGGNPAKFIKKRILEKQ